MEISFDDYLEYNLLQLRSQVGEEIVISLEKVLLGEIKAGKLEYETELLGHEKTIVYLQYLILDGRTQFILTFTSEKSNYVQNGPLFERIAQSFRLVR